MAPAQRGDRDDLFYEVECSKCSGQSGSDCQKCESDIVIAPNWRISTQSVQLSNLNPARYYKFKVIAKNGVSSIANSDAEYGEIMVRTSFKPPTGIANVNLQDITAASVRMSWDAPPRPNGQIIEYETVLSSQSSDLEIRNQTKGRDIRINGLEPQQTYTFKVSTLSPLISNPLPKNHKIVFRHA